MGRQHQLNQAAGTTTTNCLIWNTLEISLLQILFAFPLPIILALMINELRNAVYKRLIQSMVYLPHFLSWVVVVGIFVVFLKSDGIVNQFLKLLGIGHIPFLTSPEWFKPLIVLQVIWKDRGGEPSSSWPRWRGSIPSCIRQR